LLASEPPRQIKEQFGNQPFRVRDAADAGIPRHIPYRLRDDDLARRHAACRQRPRDVQRVRRACGTCPAATIGLNSGLSYWDLSDELPEAIDLAVARGAHWPKIDTPATRPHRFARRRSALDWLQLHTDAGEAFWIYSAERCTSTPCGSSAPSAAIWRCLRCTMRLMALAVKKLDVEVGDLVQISGRRYDVVSDKAGGVALEPVITKTVDRLHAKRGARPLTADEFTEHFGQLAADGEG
jgi:hypothetical protein